MAKFKPVHVVGAALVVIVGTIGFNWNNTSPTHIPPVPVHTKSFVPGVIDSKATKAKVCVPGYSSTVRPPKSYTNALKVKQLKQWNYKDQNPTHFEEDHFIPLELGGSPTDPSNLWPEPWSEAHKKDIEENALHASVCSGKLTLAQAQARMAQDWK